MLHTPPVVDSPGQKMATSRLLQTKLYVPRSGHGLVPRPRLIQRLNQGTAGKLTVVSAPAAFGETTLLGGWLATSEGGSRPRGMRGPRSKR
jgi:ATP/maltotriose-dependent transcriptional regulator MalT